MGIFQPTKFVYFKGYWNWRKNTILQEPLVSWKIPSPRKRNVTFNMGPGIWCGKSQEEMCEKQSSTVPTSWILNHHLPFLFRRKTPPTSQTNHQITKFCLQKRKCWVNIEVSTPLGKLMPCCFCSGFEETNVSLAIVFPNPWQSLQMASIMTHFQHLREFCSEDPSRTGDLLH